MLTRSGTTQWIQATEAVQHFLIEATLLVTPGLDSQKMWRRIEHEEIGHPTTRVLVCICDPRFVFARRRNELASTKCESFGVGGVLSCGLLGSALPSFIVRSSMSPLSLKGLEWVLSLIVVLYWTTPLPSLASLFAVLCRLWRQGRSKENMRSWVFFLAASFFCFFWIPSQDGFDDKRRSRS